MAFIKKEKKASGTYLKVVEAYRGDNGKPRHRTLYNLGKAEQFSNKSLKNIANMFLNLAGEKPKSNMKELQRLNYGFGLIYDKVMKHYELDKVLKNIEKRNNLEYDLYKTVLLMLIERLNDPASKLSNYSHQDEYYGFGDIDLHHLYRSLDRLCENQEIIQEQIYSKGRNLFNQKLDLVFYDVTTFYFESEKEDGFRNIGYNKDGKIGKTVIVFGMLIDKDSNPIGYRIYKGGFYEGYSFTDAVKKLKEEYEIEKVITVADRGMMNKTNIDAVEEGAGYEYIIGERLRNLPENVQEKILNKTDYKKKQITDEKSGETIELQYKIVEHDGKKLITTYSSKRAAKDRHDRERRIERGKEMIQKGSTAEKKARRNYLKVIGKKKYEIDEEKIEKDARYDGLACIATNTKELTTEEVLSAYRQLYKIEQTFRTFKTYLETRPMFHWTEKRIRGHLCLCYIAYTLLSNLQRQLLGKGKKQSENRIRENLCKMQLSMVEDIGERFYLRSYLNEEMADILKVMNIKRLPNIIKHNEISQYIS